MQLVCQSRYTKQIVVVSTSDLAETFNREALFFAANRVEVWPDQCEQMPWEWQRMLRMLIDVVEMPSMSVGDRYALLSEAGAVVSSGIVNLVGWRDLFDDELEPLLAAAADHRGVS